MPKATASIRLSDAELDVMDVLWSAAGPIGAIEVAERTPEARAWSLTTVKTLLSRLLAKGAVEPAKDGRRFLYSPAIERDAYVGAESRRFVSRLFGGKISPLIASLADEEVLDQDDVAEIEALLKRLKS